MDTTQPAPWYSITRRTSWVIGLCITFCAGVSAGITATYLLWRPYGDGSLTRAIVRKCGVREAPRLADQRCSEVVDDALTTWFVTYYPGEAPSWLRDDPLERIRWRTTEANTRAKKAAGGEAGEVATP